MKDVYSGKSGKNKEVKRNKKPSIRQEIYRLVGTSRGTVGAFVARPKKISFDGQDSEEKIILLLRQHPVVNLKWMSIAAIMLATPLFLAKVPLLEGFPANFRLASITIWYLLAIAFIIEQSLSWLFNIGIITTHQAMDIDFFSLIYKRATEADISKIQDVTAYTGGVLQTFFNYGSVYIQTAGEKRELEFINIPNPSLVAEVIEKLRLEHKRGGPGI